MMNHLVIRSHCDPHRVISALCDLRREPYTAWSCTGVIACRIVYKGSVERGPFAGSRLCTLRAHEIVNTQA